VWVWVSPVRLTYGKGDKFRTQLTYNNNNNNYYYYYYYDCWSLLTVITECHFRLLVAELSRATRDDILTEHFRCLLHGGQKNCTFPCLMLNWYSFMKSQTKFYNFWQTYTWIDSQQSNAYTVHRPQHLLCVSTLPCRNNIVRFLCCLKMKFAHELCWKTTK